MLSQLSKGYGSWTAGYVDPYFGDKKERECTLPEIDQESHFHGVTVGPRSGRSTAMSWVTSKRSREPTIDGIPLPKTYTTRKGALQLFVGPDDLEDDDDDNDEENESYSLKPKYVQIKRPHGQELIDLSLKLGTMERLAMSVLQFGDEDYDHEHTSVTDSKNKAFLKFLHSVDEAPTKADVDSHVQPGGDLKKYLKDLKTKAGSRFGSMYVSKSRESLELQAILRGLDNSSWPLSYSQDGASEKSGTGQFTRPVSRVSSRGPSPGPPSTPRSSYQVLSAKKVAASIKSGTYLGRPSSRISVVDDDLSENEPGGTGQITPSIMRTSWTPTDSTDDFLIDTREKFYLGDEDGESSEDGRKRRRFKERTFLTNNSQLYQGRNAHKGEGQRAMEVKVVNKGDGDSLGHKMSQIEEELGDLSESKKHLELMSNNKGKSEKDFGDDEDSDNDTWAVNVSNIKQINVSEDEPDDDVGSKRSKLGTDLEFNNKNVTDPVAMKLKVRPQSAKSDISNSSSVSTRSASTHAMSIITLQSLNNQHNNKQHNNLDKHNFSKRKGTYTYDPEKGLVRSTKDRQRSEPFISSSGNSSHSVETSKILYSQKKSPSAGKTASLQSDDTDGKLLLQLGSTIHQNDDLEADVHPEETLEMDNVEAQQTDQEDYVLDNIDECNEEIQQIEAQANATDQESDSDSCMDEEVIKVILEGQKTDDIVDEDQHDFESVNADENFQDDQIQSVEMVTGEIKSRSSTVNDGERNSAGSRSYAVNEGGDNVSMSRSSEVNEGDGKIASEDIFSNAGDELENIIDADDNKTVDEIYDENVSEVKSIRSTKSGRKSQSKKTKSVLESEDGGDEYKLPVLASDRLEEKDGINSEDIQTADDEQTGFSGSSASYSDILVDDKLSEPEIVSQSRNSSTHKLSRPSSVTLDADVPQGEMDNIENTSSKPDDADEMSDCRGSDKDNADAEENEQIHDENASLKNEDAPIEDVDDKQIDEELSALENEDFEKEVDNVVNEVDQTQSPEALQLNENVKQSEDDLPIDKVEIKVLVEIGGNDRLDEKKADARDKSEIEESSSTTELITPVPNADVTKPIAETKDEPKIKTTVESPQVLEKRQEDPKQKKKVNNNLENKSSVQKPTLKTEQKPVKTSKSGNAGKTSVVAGNKNGNKTKSVAPSGDKSKTKVSNKDNTGKTEEGVKPNMGSAVLEGEGLLNLESELASKVDEEHGEGLYYDADLDDNARTGEKDAHAIAAELDALGLTKTKKGSKVYPLLPPGQRPKAPAEKQKIPDHLQDALNRKASESRQYLEEDLERMTAMVGETLSGPTLEAVGEGLTEEELEIAKQILQQKLDEAKGQLDGKPTTKGKGKKSTGKGGKKTGKKKNDPSDDKTKEEIDREAIRAKHDHEKQIREQEAADLQRKIAENKRLLKQQADQSSSRSKELLDEMERLEREAADMQQAEDEARQILADERKKQREEREARRKADLERKKQEALDRREREKKEMDDKRRKEMEMMEKIADAEMRRRMREEEERRLDEEERLAQERYEAEMREAQKLEEEEEERLKEMERQAEEEAMQRLIEEREAAERERRRIREEEEAFREAEMRRMEKMAEEHRKLEEERKRLQDIEDAKREAERQNLLKLRQLEEEARLKMQEEIEKRRNEALARRDFNLENKQNVDKLRHYQGITRAWTFSYFVHWPRETYERPIGSGDPRKVKIKNPPPKKVTENAAADNTEVPTAIVP